MIYFFTGNTDFLVIEQVKAWKKNFIEKFGDFNLIHLKDINGLDNNFLIENLTSSSFLNEKKLIIIDLNDGLIKEKEDFLLLNLDNIPDENIVLFNQVNPDKRSKLYKTLTKKSTLKEFNTKNDSEKFSIINNKYSGKISNDAINTIIKYKSGNISKIISEIEKLLITIDFIETKHIFENITPELEESIFQVIDDILNSNPTQALKKINIILNEINIYAFYNNLIANLRTSIYIMKLKNNGIKSKQIQSTLNLGNRSFLVNKSYKLSYSNFEKKYINLVKIDKKMKSGFLTGTGDKDFRYELEKIIIQ